MSIYGKILFEHHSFQDLISQANPSPTRDHVVNLMLADEEGPLYKKFDTKVDKAEGQRLITADEVSKLEELKNYDDTEVYNKIDEVESTINSTLTQEIQARSDQDTILNNQISELKQSFQEMEQDLQDLIGTAQEKEELMSLIKALKDQLTEDSLVILMARVQQLEKILYSDNLIIGEVDENTYHPISPTNVLIYDGGLVTQKEEIE